MSDITKVVNCKVQYIRPEFKNLKEWINSPNNVYIGRKGVVFIDGIRYPPNGSPFCNPFKEGSLEERIDKYRDYIIEKLNADKELFKELMKLKGKNLGCWCKPEKCHGDVLVEMLTQYNDSDTKAK